MTTRISVLAMTSVLSLAGLPTTGLAESTAAVGLVEVGSSLADLKIEVDEYVSAPADNLFPGDIFPLFAEVGPAISDLASGWAYANETGRVRAVVTARRDASSGGAGRTNLLWYKWFRKDSAADTAKFTINRSTLSVGQAGTSVSALLKQPPTAKLDFRVSVQSPDVQGGAYAFSHSARVAFVSAIPDLVEERTDENDTNLYDYNLIRGKDELGRLRRVPAVTIGSSSGFLYEMGPYTGTIDISKVPVGSTYRVIYHLTVAAQNVEGESNAFAYLGDPLDVDSGFNLETNSTPVDVSSPRFCEVAPDRSRYVISAGADMVTDLYNGLSWQRCPASAVLNNRGTPADASDDRCDAANVPAFSWQAALQHSTTSAIGDFNDWRLPNIKELESLVEPRCLPLAFDTAVFPAIARPKFWSSTPSPQDGAKVETINFFIGETGSSSKTDLADLRLVRSSGGLPLPPPPALSVGRPSAVVESDSGTRLLTFPVRLDAPAAADVTVRYATRNGSATAGSDYTSTTGVLVIPAGSTAAQIGVPVLSDLIAEQSEVLHLDLSNVSLNARLRQASAAGQIDDNEPVASIVRADATEPQVGTEFLTFYVILDKPAVEPITLTFDTTSASATAGQDFTAETGQVTIPAGSQSTAFGIPLLADALVEGDEYLLATLRTVSSHGRIESRSAQARGYILDADDTPALRRLNDTTVDVCAITGGLLANFGACPQAAAPRQDAEHGRDFTLNNDANGTAGFVFAKLDAAGAPLANQAADYAVTPWDCVHDTHTGLYWEVKTDNGGLRDKDWTYSWYNSTGIQDGGSAGAENLGRCVDAANCDTQKFVAAVNAVGACGFNDWRLPTRDELLSVVALQPPPTSNLLPAYDLRYFPNTLAGASYYSTATPRAVLIQGTGFDTSQIWAIERDGRMSSRAKSAPNPVRLVRGAP